MSRTMAPVSTGEMLEEEFLKPLEMTKYRLAKSIGVPAQRIGEIVAGRRSITADRAVSFPATARPPSNTRVAMSQCGLTVWRSGAAAQAVGLSLQAGTPAGPASLRQATSCDGTVA